MYKVDNLLFANSDGSGIVQLGHFSQQELAILSKGVSTNHITASGDISASGDYYVGLGKNVHFAEGDTNGREYKIQTNNSGLDFTSGSTTHMLLKNGGGTDFDGDVTVSGDISGSGEVYAVSASFGSLSNTTNRWTDGSNGNDEFIAITPSDFALTDMYSRGDEFPHYTDDSGGSILPSGATANYFALKMIPKGFTAIEVYIYSDSSDGITVYEGNIANATTTSKGSGNTNTTINITDVDGDGTNYLSIKWNPSSTFDNIYGGKINIQRTS